MAGTALIIGGTGQVGQAAARRLLGDGWDVTVAHRGGQSPLAGVREAILDRQDDQAVDALLRQGYDVVVDLLAFRPVHADQLLRQAGRIGSLVVMSSAAVYRDPQGRTLQDVRDAATSPVFAHPVHETNPVVSEHDDSYAGRKRAVEIALTESAIPSTMIRPGAIHGPRSPQPREWFYVKRVLDGRRVFVHGFGGRGSLHPAAAENIAEMIRLAAKKPGSRVLNAGDPGLPDERGIAQALAVAMGAEVAQVLLPSQPPIASPWSLPEPFFLALEAAEREIGYRPVTTYAEAARATCKWIVEEVAAGTFPRRLSDRFGPPGLGSQVFVGQGFGPFDYDAEDRALAALRGTGRTTAAA